MEYSLVLSVQLPDVVAKGGSISKICIGQKTNIISGKDLEKHIKWT